MTAAPPSDPARPTDLKVLVVDDDAPVRDLVARFLQDAGLECFTAGNADETLELIEKESIAVVILDILIPGGDGLELTKLIRERSAADVMLITGQTGRFRYEQAVARGASDFIFKPVRREELLLRLERIVRERAYRAEREELLRKLQRLAVTDSLTELFNARHFHEQLELEVDRSNRYGHPVSLLLMDVDNFKQYNDRFGHLAGNEVLVRLGRIITFCLRRMDSAYRYGGEEFTVILPETPETEALRVAERIRRSIEENRFRTPDGRLTGVTVSIGVTQYRPGEEIDDFVRRADQLMYQTKRAGRNRVSAPGGLSPA